MKGPKRTAPLPLLALCLTSCYHWEKPGATEADFQRAQSICDAEAASQFPPNMREVVITPASVRPVTYNCNTVGDSYYANTTCAPTGGQYVPAVTQTVDDNSNARFDYGQACLFRNGWQKVRNR
jgi:hypothetical protein